MLKGAARDQLMTPDTDSLKSRRALRGAGPQVHGPPFAEQGVDDVVLRVLDVQSDVHAEFVQHYGGWLGSTYMPGDGPAHEAAQQRPVQVDAPVLHPLPPAPERTSRSTATLTPA